MLALHAVNCFAQVVAPEQSGGGIVYAFQHSNYAGKAVILVLMLGSIFSWSVMGSKIYMIRRARKETRRFLKRFRTARKPLAIYQNREAYPDSPSYAVYLAGCRELTFHLLGTTEIDDTFSTRLAEADRVTPVAMNAVRSALEREVGEQALQMESNMTVLATAVSGAPFLGLLGTVWGRDGHLQRHRRLQQRKPHHHGARRFRRTHHHGHRPARRHSRHVRLQLPRRHHPRHDRGTRQLRRELAASFDHRYLDTGSTRVVQR